MRPPSRLWVTAVVLAVVVVGGAIVPVLAQGSRELGAVEPLTAQEGALIDLTGQWVSVVTEDWRWRMVTPPPGDYASVPLNDEGRRVADLWDWQRQTSDKECRAYGPPGLIRLPGRIRISWADAETLRFEFDAGMQTRLLRFAAGSPGGERSRQGWSEAAWHKQEQSTGFWQPRPSGPGGALRVETTNLLDGYLRKNGVPHSADAVVQEFLNSFTVPGGDTWLIVTTVVVESDLSF